MKIAKGRFVLVTYVINIDGDSVERRTKDYPLGFIFGEHRMFPKFENELEGLDEGDKFCFMVQPEEGYGPFREELVINVPYESFMVDGIFPDNLIEIGKRITLNMEDGTEATGEVLFNNGYCIKMDFNHPFAGKTLVVSGEVLHVEDISSRETSDS